tara:strand:+ start:1240 stop:1404 length:165 start_codon:yes stop_codon:yes gene_type:complete
MVYGNYDMIPKSKRIHKFVPNVEKVSLNCGHCIQQELSEETNQTILEWLKKQDD